MIVYQISERKSKLIASVALAEVETETGVRDWKLGRNSIAESRDLKGWEKSCTFFPSAIYEIHITSGPKMLNRRKQCSPDMKISKMNLYGSICVYLSCWIRIPFHFLFSLTFFQIFQFLLLPFLLFFNLK